MRKRMTGGGVTLQAISGTDAVFLAGISSDAVRPGCLGFAISRRDHAEGEEYWITGFKTFRSMIPIPRATTQYSSHEHPLQTFYWGDYSAKPGREYTYRLVPRYGTPARLEDRTGVEASVDVDHRRTPPRASTASTSTAALRREPGVHRRGSARRRISCRRTSASRRCSGSRAGCTRRSSRLSAARRPARRPCAPRCTSSPSRACSPRSSRPTWQARTSRSCTTRRRTRRATRTGKRSPTPALDPAILIERTNAKIAHNKFIVLCDRDQGGRSRRRRCGRGRRTSASAASSATRTSATRFATRGAAARVPGLLDRAER